MTETEARLALVEAARSSVRMGLNSGTVGNFSLRHGAGMLITPTGMAGRLAALVGMGDPCPPLCGPS